MKDSFIYWLQAHENQNPWYEMLAQDVMFDETWPQDSFDKRRYVLHLEEQCVHPGELWTFSEAWDEWMSERLLTK